MESDDQGILSPGAALLLIIGEPTSEDHKTLILSEITKGFRCWDVEDTGININEELAQIANRASLGKEGVNGERIIQHQSDNLAVEILINPLAQSVKASLKQLLVAPAPTKYIIYAGHSFQGSGAWILQDDTFAFSNLAQVFKNVDVENALKQNIEANLTIHTLADSNWGTSISKADFTNNLRIQLNPPEKLDNIHGVLQFTAYVGGFMRVLPLNSLLQASEQFGNISFTRPTLYIFPGCQGDSALFGVNGFNFLVNGGYNRRACFWDFARHLDRIDAMLMTHLGADNIFGLSTVLQRKSLENIHPQIGYLYLNALEKAGAGGPSVEAGDGGSDNSPTLLVNLAEEANKMTQMAKQLGISPHPCSRSATAANLEPINLYHKLGHGSLDMYIQNPVADSKEMKEFYQLWGKQAANLDTSGPFPLPNALSVCALLVWKPYNFDEKIVRILFPGNAPQHKVVEGFEKMKSFGFLKFPSCTTRDLMKPPAVKKPAAGASKAGGVGAGGRVPAKAPSSARGEKVSSSRVESPRKETRAAPTRAEAKPASPTKPARPVKEDTNNKKNNGKVKEKPKTNEPRPKSAPAKEEEKIKREAKGPVSSPNKGQSNSNKAPSPTKTSAPSKSPSPPKTPSPTKLSPTKTKAPPAAAATTVKAEESKSIVAAATADQAGSDAPVVSHAPAVSHVEEHDIKPESERSQPSKQDHAESLQTLDDAISEARDAVGAVDDVSVSVSSGMESLSHFEEPSAVYGKQITDYAKERDSYDFEEEEKPQALPEPPVIIESPSQDSDIMPDYTSKIESDEQELSEFSRAEEELKKLDGDTSSHDPAMEIPLSPESLQKEQKYPTSDEQELLEFSQAEEELKKLDDDGCHDPALEIPLSPECLQEEQHYPTSVEPAQTFETPIFSNDEADIACVPGQSPVRKNIQYGIDDSSNERDMGGIQEVDEEEQDDDIKDNNRNIKDENTNQRQLASQDNIADQEEDDSINGFEKDSNPDEEEIKKDCSSKDEEIEDKLAKNGSASFERQGNEQDKHSYEGSDEGVEDDRSQSPAAFDKDSNPDADEVDNEDKDSIDGGIPGDDQDILESSLPKMNGNVVKSAGIESKSAAVNSFASVEADGQTQKHGLVDESDDDQSISFDPLSHWGQPMGLPAPPTNEEGRRGVKTDSKTSRPDARKRPATAPPTAGRGAATRPGSASKKLAVGSSRLSPADRAPPLPPMTPFYVDLTYIPNHGDSGYSDVEFFKRIRARNYVISALSPNPQVLDSLLEAKESWEQKDLEVTIIPTYESEILRHWMGLNKERLQELHVDMTPPVCRCTIKLQDLETSLPAYRLEV